MSKLLHILGSSAVLAVLASSPVSAQYGDPGIFGLCGEAELCPWGADHTNYGGQIFEFGHYACQYCSAAAFGICLPGCAESLAESQLKAAYAKLLEAAKVGDGGRIVALASTASGYVHYNSVRGAVQIINCDKSSVVASIPLRRDQIRIAIATLPHYPRFGVQQANALGPVLPHEFVVLAFSRPNAR